MMQQKTEVVELVPYDQEDEDVLILKIPDSANVDSPVSKRSTELQSYDDLLTTDEKLKKKIIDKYVSGSDAPVDLNIDYSNYENFINFSSAEKRLKNFKYKIQQIEGYTADSSSLVGVTSADTDLVSFDNKIRNLKNDFDGYEKYLYHTSSSYSSGSMGASVLQLFCGSLGVSGFWAFWFLQLPLFFLVFCGWVSLYLRVSPFWKCFERLSG